MNTKHLFRVSLMIITLAWICSCQKTETPDELIQNSMRPAHAGFNENDMVLYWNEKISNVLSKTTSPPPVLSRHFTMAQVAVHDALNSIVPKYQTYALTDARDKYADPDAAITSAAYWTFRQLDTYLKTFPPFTNGLPLQISGNDWDGWYASALGNIPDGAAKDAGIELGKKAAHAIMAKRANDGFADARIVYVAAPPSNPAAGVWRPTIAQFPPVPPSHIGGLPYWGTKMKTFTVNNNAQFRPGPPPALSSKEYADAYNEVKSLGARVGSTRTADQSVVANFWQETPTNIWNRFAREALLNKKVDAWRSARLLALVNVAIFDALVTSFDAVYHYYTWRPESAIRSMQDDGNPLTNGQADWLPYVTDIKIGPPPQTPTTPIPEYPNTNSTLGSAAAEAMRLFFETDKTYVNLVTQDVTVPGTSRLFTSFSQAANEYGDSRLYAGFGFRFSIDTGDEMGQKAGKHVFENIFREN